MNLTTILRHPDVAAAYMFTAWQSFRRDPVAALKCLERGDADSSGSTLRTAGVVALVLIVLAVIGGAVALIANRTAGNITNADFGFGSP